MLEKLSIIVDRYNGHIISTHLIHEQAIKAIHKLLNDGDCRQLVVKRQGMSDYNPRNPHNYEIVPRYEDMTSKEWKIWQDGFDTGCKNTYDAAYNDGYAQGELDYRNEIKDGRSKE